MIRKYIRILPLVLMITASLNSYGQSIMRSSICSLGSSASGDGFVLRQTVGQPSNTFIGSNGLMVLRQGFQQPLALKTIIPAAIPLVFTIYPNPAKERTLLEFSEEVPAYDLIITSVNGKVVSRLNNQTLLSNWLELSELPPGMYIVTITSDLRTGSRKLIVKQ